MFLTSSNATNVRVAFLGRQGSRGILTSQVYGGGNILKPVDGQGWALISGSDLTLSVYGSGFLASEDVRFPRLPPRCPP